MTRIKGLNDQYTLKSKNIEPAITVWKGAKKSGKSAGKSLESQFRIEAPPSILAMLAQAYNTTVTDGSLFVNSLNIVPAYNCPLKTFTSRMEAHNASRPILFCDRATIHTRFVADARNYYAPIENDEPCPVAGTNHRCPNGCARVGTFYFYIWELLLAGLSEFARLKVGGVKDNQNIALTLDEVQAEVGAIKTSPFVNQYSRNYIIYILSRRQVTGKFPVFEGGKRTDKRGRRPEWIVNLALHPIWRGPYDFYLSSERLKKACLSPSPKLISQVYGDELVVAESKALALPEQHADSPSPVASRDSGVAAQDAPERSGDWQMNRDRALHLQTIWRQHGWHAAALKELLYSYFGFENMEDLQSLDRTEFHRLEKYLQDPKIKQEYI